MLEYFRELLLRTKQFSDWAAYPDLFSLSLPAPDCFCFDLHISKLPDRPIVVTGREIAVDIPDQLNAMQTKYRFLESYVSSGSPQGGTIRFSWDTK